MNERRIPLYLRRRKDFPVTSSLLPIVGGWRCIAEELGLAETEALAVMREEIGKRQGRKVYVVLREAPAHWSPDPVMHAYVGGHLLGYVPEEHTPAVEDRTLTHLPALLSFRGRTAYAVLLG